MGGEFGEGMSIYSDSDDTYTARINWDVINAIMIRHGRHENK